MLLETRLLRAQSDLAPEAIDLIARQTQEARQPMDQTPIHESFNRDLLNFIPAGLQRIVEVGSSSGVLAREYKRANPNSEYIGVEIDEQYAERSRRFCDRVLVENIEQMDDATFGSLFPADAFVFGDVLEHLYDPWALLRRIRASSEKRIYVVACIPNAQHWSIQANLSAGLFVYQNFGLMDRTHIRWFTRKTIIDLFRSTGYENEDLVARATDDPARDAFLPMIEAMARNNGSDPQAAVNDAIPIQYVIRSLSIRE